MEDIKDIYVSVIFEEKPQQWGLRGDPYLWEEMSKEFSTVPINISLEDFIEEYKRIFEKLTGTPLTRDCHLFISEFAHVGMSSGQICGEFWNDKALPLLSERLKNVVRRFEYDI